MAKKTVTSNNPGLILVSTYAVLYGINMLILYLAHLLFPQFVVLGTMTMNIVWALLHSMGVLTLLNTFAIPFVRELEHNRGHMFTPREWMLLYFAINTAGIWLIARVSEQFGLGISAWYVAVVLGLVLDFIQGLAMMQVEKTRT